MEKYYFMYFKIEDPKEWDSNVSSIHPFEWVWNKSASTGRKHTLINFHQIKKEEYELYMSLNPEE